MTKNKIVNDILRKNKKDKYIWQRSGTCNFIKCQSACCRFNCVADIDLNGHAKNYHNMSDYNDITGVQVRIINKTELYLTPRLCPYIKIEGGCILHEKRTQPRVCKYFPMHPCDGVYKAVKHVCGYKFKKIKNLNYAPEKIKLEKIKE